MTSGHKASLRASTETLLKLTEGAADLQAQILRGALPETVEARRAELMDMAEAYIDLMIAAGVQVRKIIES